MSKRGPKVLFLDIETRPILAYVWAIWDQNVGLNQIKEDWSVISWAASWLGEEKVMQRDLRKTRRLDNDKHLLKPMWKLLDQADIIVTQNGKKFDAKKLNARFIINGMKPPSSYRHIDICQIAKSRFGFTSNKLEYLADKLCVTYKKLKHDKFPGFELWRECIAGNQEAWKEMAKYNIYDVLVLKEVHSVMSPWDTSVNFNVYHNREDSVCQCGHPAFERRGYRYSNAGKYQAYRCKGCGAWYQSKVNLLPAIKRKEMLKGFSK